MWMHFRGPAVTSVSNRTVVPSTLHCVFSSRNHLLYLSIYHQNAARALALFCFQMPVRPVSSTPLHGAELSSTLHGAALEHSALVQETAALTEETAELRSLSSACGSALGYHPPPEHYQIGLMIATIGLFITMGLHRRAVRILRARTAFSSKRVLYRLITGLPPAIAWVHFLAVTSPPMHRVAALAHHCLVAFVMACFMELLLLLLFRTARAGEGGVDESAVPAIPNVLQHPNSTTDPNPNLPAARLTLAQP